MHPTLKASYSGRIAIALATNSPTLQRYRIETSPACFAWFVCCGYPGAGISSRLASKLEHVSVGTYGIRPLVVCAALNVNLALLYAM